MKIINILLIFFTLTICGQNNVKRAFKFEGEVRGVFEVIHIDSSNSVHLVTLKLKYLLDSEKIKNIDVPSSYEVVIYSEKKKIRKVKNNPKIKKVELGSEYYFDLKHMFFYKTLFPGPNEIPYALIIDSKLIWNESSPFGIYTTYQLTDLYYVK